MKMLWCPNFRAPFFVLRRGARWADGARGTRRVCDIYGTFVYNGAAIEGNTCEIS